MKKRFGLTQIQIVLFIAAIIIVVAGVWYFSQPSKPETPTINKPPIVMASTSKTFAEVDKIVGFSAAGSRDPDGKIVKYTWNFGDGSTSEGFNVTHVYKLPGDYIAMVVVVDDRGANATNLNAPVFVKVEKPIQSHTLESPPVALIAVSNPIIDTEKSINIDGASSYGWKKSGVNIVPDSTIITTWNWDFGDGESAVGKNVTHVFKKTGSYLVKLTVKNKENKTDTSARTIRVVLPGSAYSGLIKNPDTLVFATNMEMASSYEFDKLSGGMGRPIKMSISDMLTFTGPSDVEPKAAGSLSERWEISPDGKHYTFYLRKGVKFWNGDELKAEDIEYSFERSIALLGPLRGWWPLVYERMIGIRPGNPVPDNIIKNAVEVVDDHTVRFNFIEPYAPFLVELAYPEWKWIVQKKYAIDHGAWHWGDSRNFTKLAGIDQPMYDGTALMCTGPYKIVELAKGERIVLERFDDYWQGPAKIKYIRYIYVAEWSTRKLLIEAGDADGIVVANPTQFEQLVGVTGIKPIQSKYRGHLEAIYFGINFDPTKVPAENKVPPDFFDDVHMRRAFAYAFPYERYIKEIWLGYAERAKSNTPKGWLGSFECFPYEHNLTKAAEELKLAHGGKYWNEGFHVCAGCQIWAIGTHGRAYDMLAEELAKINPKFKLTYVGTKWADMLEAPMGMLVGVIGLDPTFAALEPFHSQFGWEWQFGWRNELKDQYITNSSRTTLMENRLPLIEKAMKIVADECPLIMTVFNPEFVAYRDWVKGYYYQVNWLSAPGLFYLMEKG